MRSLSIKKCLMKIFQVIPNLGSGGAERFVVDLSNELAQQGHDVTLLTLYDLVRTHGFYKDEIDGKVRVVSFHKSLGLSIRNIIKVAQFIRKEKPDIIHSHVGALQYTIIPQVLLGKGVHTVHNEAQLEASGKLEVLLRKLVFKFGLVQAVTISPESHDSFVRFYKREAPLIMNGRAISGEIKANEKVNSEINQYKKSTQSRVIVQLARFQPQKNIPMMARVAKRLYDENYDFTLLFIGSTENEQIVSEVTQYMPPCAHILGERMNPLEYLKEADAFALSSEYEGMPISLIEALAVGAVPVCTPVGGIPNAIVDGKNGFLSHDASEKAYYETLKRFFTTDSDHLRQMSVNAKESFSAYSMEECAKKYQQLYGKLK